MTTTFQQSPPLHALLTSIEDYAEDWESVLTDEEYVKPGAHAKDGAVKQVEDKIDNADQTVQSSRKNRLAEHNWKQATEERGMPDGEDGHRYTPMLAVDRQVDLVREVHACCSQYCRSQDV
jgi:hypothetical protein